ncbi:hypothetical protein EHM82_04060, partial [bacterium]
MTSPLTEQDLYLFNEGTHYRLYEKLGAHPGTNGGQEGVWFAVWAPDAESVSVIGESSKIMWRPAPCFAQPSRRATMSGRARQSIRIGASMVSMRCSRRSIDSSCAKWRSSKT